MSQFSDGMPITVIRSNASTVASCGVHFSSRPSTRASSALSSVPCPGAFRLLRPAAVGAPGTPAIAAGSTTTESPSVLTAMVEPSRIASGMSAP